MSTESTAPRSTRVLDWVDVASMAMLMAVGLALRLHYWSGYGLGDDRIYRMDIISVLEGRLPITPQNAYRFTWWLPTAVTARFFGPTETGLIAPITAFAVLGIGVVYALGKVFWGRAGGLIAAALLIVHPLDFTWATMLAPDFILSVFSGLCVFFVVRALDHDAAALRRRSWVLAAVALWLSYHSKLSGVLLAPALAVIAALRFRRLDWNVLAFVATAALLFGGSVLVSYAMSGDPIASYHGELYAQGLRGSASLATSRATRETFLIYPRILFLRDNVGDLLYSIYPHALVVLALLSPWLGLRTSLPMFAWLAAVFVGLEFNVQAVEGGFIAGFRNIRHTHVFVYPLILLLTGYLVTLRARFPRLGAVTVTALLAVSAWLSIATASTTVTAFGDMRRAAYFLADLPRKPIHSDFQLLAWLPIMNVNPPLTGQDTFRESSDQARKHFEAIHGAYVVTGGGREPYYGCMDCIPRADDLAPSRWRLLMEFQGPPPTWWRLEPLRVWESTD